MSAPEVLVPLPTTPGAAARPIDGPRWVLGARALETEMVDGRGVRWWVESVEAGDGGRRKARTEIAADHPDAPSEAAVLAAERERARQTRARRRTA
jgi:hypothetical protein